MIMTAINQSSGIMVMFKFTKIMKKKLLQLHTKLLEMTCYWVNTLKFHQIEGVKKNFYRKNFEEDRLLLWINTKDDHL